VTGDGLTAADLKVRREPTQASPQDLAIIEAQIGRPARGVHGVAARCVCSRPLVARTKPRLPDGTPFPTTYYLTEPAAVRAIGTLESSGLMAKWNQRLECETDLAAAYLAAHLDYLRQRAELGAVPELDGVSAGGMPRRVKCLHVLAAHALARGPGINVLGDEVLVVLAPMWRPDRCSCVALVAEES
jgi:hypothetical protein